MKSWFNRRKIASLLALALLASPFITAAPARATGAPMVLNYNFPADDHQVWLPLFGNVNVVVDWGDGGATDTVTNQTALHHMYSSGGDYQVTITGTLDQFGNYTDWFHGTHNLISVDSFGDLGLTSLAGAFRGGSRLTQVPSVLPSTVTRLDYAFYASNGMGTNVQYWNTTNVTSMRGTFQENQSQVAFDLSGWNVSNVTDFFAMFYNDQYFNSDISSWTPTSALTFEHMFHYANVFNQNLDSWNVSSANNFTYMFADANSFNQPLNSWNVSNAVEMGRMFEGADSFDQPLNNWNTSNVTNMNAMFRGTNAFNQNISSWNTSKVMYMNEMFQATTSFNQPLNLWDVSSVENMYAMFNGSAAFNQTLNLWDVSSVTNFQHMFSYSQAFNGDISTWNLASAQTLESMFQYSAVFQGDLNSWRMPLATNFSWMFHASHFNQDIGDWDVSAGIYFTGMFHSAWDFNQDISGWDVSSAQYMNEMFNVASAFNQPIGSWDTSSAINMWAMFANTDNFNKPLVQNATPGGWNVSNLVYAGAMFANAAKFNQSISSWDTASLQEIQGMFSGTLEFNSPIVNTVGGWNPVNVTNMSDMFNSAHAFNQDISSWNTPSLLYINNMFRNAYAFNQPIVSSAGHWNTSNVVSMNGTFAETWVFDQDLNTWDTGKVTEFSSMFYVAREFNGDISNWDTSSGVNFSAMFQSAVKYNQPLNSWDVSSGHYFGAMFTDAQVFNQPLNSWDTSSAEQMHSMFSSAYKFNQPLNNWNVSNVYYFHEMFRNALEFNQDLDQWNTASAQLMHWMFAGAADFNGDISTWDLNGVSNTDGMFYAATSFNSDISNWDVSTIYNFSSMFNYAIKFNQPIENWDVTGGVYFNNMFNNAWEFNQPIFLWDTHNAREFHWFVRDAYEFNQDLSGWDLTQAYYFDNMLWGSATSKAHYSRLLNNFADTNVHDNRSLHASVNYLCSAADARAHLVDDKHWYIQDYGQADCLTEQSITFNQPDDFAVNKVRFLEATATSELPVTFKWISGPCHLDGNILSATAEGVCVVAANQEGDETYSDAPQKIRWINILKPSDPDIIYMANGATTGSAPIDSDNPHAIGYDVTLKPQSGLQLTDALFTGWNTKADGTGVHYDASEVIEMPDNDLILYAEWFSLVPHMVDYDANGADGGTPPLGATHMQMDQFQLPDNTDMYKEHFHFIGWNTDPDGEGDFYEAGDTFTMGAEALTFYAVWEHDDTFTITYHGNGNETGDAPNDLTAYYEGDEATVLDHQTLSRSGWSFIGWNTEEDGSGDWYYTDDLITVGTENLNLYGQWSQDDKYSVIYDENGADEGTVPDDAYRYLEDEEVTVLDQGSMAWHGHHFIGWNTEEDGSGDWYYAEDTFDHPASDVTLFAQWEEDDQFTVSFESTDADSGVAPDSISDYATDQINIPSCDLLRAGFECTGWSTEADGSGDFYATDDHLILGTEDVVLYPVWISTNTTVIKKMNIGFDRWTALLNWNQKAALKVFYKKYLKGRTKTSVIVVTGFIQHDKAIVNGKELPTPVVKHNKWLQKARAKAVIAYLRSLGAKVTFKAKLSKVNNASKKSRSAVIVATLS
jgi:surface protein